MDFVSADEKTLEGKLPLRVASVGLHHRQEPVNRPEGLPIYQCFYCSKGEGEVILTGSSVRIRPGTGFLIGKNVPHAYHPVSADWTLHILGFDGAMCDSIMRCLSLDRSLPFVLGDDRFYTERLKEIQSVIRAEDQNQNIRLSALCYQFLLELSQQKNWVSMTEKAEADEKVSEVIRYLETHFASDISLADLSEKVGVSREYLCWYFKQKMGKTIMTQLVDIRMRHARILLRQYPSKKVYEIAAMCGYENAGYFGQVFLKNVGMTPEMYRKE